MDVKKEKNQPGTGPKDPRRRKNSQGWDPRTHGRKSSANSRQGCALIVRAMEKDVSENRMRVVKVEKLVLLVKVVTDQFALRRCDSRLKRRRRIRPHRMSLGSEDGERKKSTDDGEVISTLQKAIESFQEKGHQGADQFHECNVPNIQMIVERQCQPSRRSRRLLTYTSCSSRIRWWMCS